MNTLFHAAYVNQRRDLTHFVKVFITEAQQQDWIDDVNNNTDDNKYGIHAIKMTQDEAFKAIHKMDYHDIAVNDKGILELIDMTPLSKPFVWLPEFDEEL